MSAGLYLVPTPLGNLADITLRAIDVLKSVDLVACEDTRRTLQLLNHLGISKPLWSYHAHSPQRKSRQIISALQEGKSIALVCDAGTPGVSDPGSWLVRRAVEAGIQVVSLPGPCAAIAALAGSGLPTDRFYFIGFLPRRAARAKRALAHAVATRCTVILYESPYRTKETLQWVESAAGPQAPVVVAREISKVYEEYVRGTVRDVLERLKDKSLKGEVVIVLHPSPLPVLSTPGARGEEAI